MGIFHQISFRLLLPLSLIIIKWAPLQKYKKHLLSTWERIDQRTRIDSILFEPFFYAWVHYEYLPETDPERREILKGFAMGGEAGRSWARSYDSAPIFHSSYDIPFSEANPFFSEMDKTLSELNDAVIIQIGSSSGREIAYFASKYPKLQFIGTDVYPEVIEYSDIHHKEKNLKF
jgi:hypothetical protein